MATLSVMESLRTVIYEQVFVMKALENGLLTKRRRENPRPAWQRRATLAYNGVRENTGRRGSGACPRNGMTQRRVDFSDIQWQSLILCGVSVQTAAIFTAYYRPIQMDAAVMASAVTSPLSLAFSLVLALVFVALGAAARPVRQLAGNPIALAAAAILFAGASWAGAALAPDGMPSMVCDLAARAGSAFLMIGWLCVFANFDTDTVLQTLPAVMAFGLAVIVAAVSAGPALRLPCLVLLTAVACGWLALAARITRIPSPDGAGPDEAHETAAESLAPQAGTGGSRRREGLVCVAAFLLSLLLGVLCALPFHGAANTAASPFFLYFLLMMGVALVVLSLMALLRRGNPLSRSLVATRIAGPAALTAACAVVGTIVQPPLGPLANAVGRMAMELSLLVCFLLAARHFRLPLVRTCAFGQAAFLAGNSLGMFLGLQLPPLFGVADDGLLVASVVVLLLTTEALFLLVLLYHLSRRLAARTAAAAAVEEPAYALAPAEDDDLKPEADPLDAFIDAFQLSDKEAEVLRLTVRGRSRQRIAEALFVSPGTVNTYFYRIYQKTDVHKRQELLDKIEEFQSSALSAK